MTLRRAYLRDSELDRTSYPEFRDGVVAFEKDAGPHEPRSYAGLPKVSLTRARARTLAGLEKSLVGRRSARALGATLPSKRDLSRVLQFAHGVSGAGGRGPVPSAGGLQALELYVATFESSWLPAGRYHYDRAGHHLVQVGEGADRAAWRTWIPSLDTVDGGALLWILVGDGDRVAAKYGDRGGRFLLLEAGHLMQNLCLLSASLGLATVPMGGALEPEVARALSLPASDAVLYAALCGTSK